MYMFRTRLASFMTGFATAAAGSFYFLQKEIHTGNRCLAEQAQKSYANLEARISHLEKLTGDTLSPRQGNVGDEVQSESSAESPNSV